jgi:hypothetical protein
MAASTQTIGQEVQSRAISMNWIISGRDDLIWFIGSVATSYALLFLYVSGWVPLLPMMAAWAVLIDGPHVFGTLSRTYFDRSEWRSRKRLLLGSLLFFAVGPALLLAGYGFEFLFAAAVWAYYHLIKQHYGFMVLYKKKNRDLARTDNALDRVLLLLAFTYPFLAYIAHDQDAMTHVPAPLKSGMNTLALIVLAATITVFIAWTIRQVQRAVTGLPLNVPKYLLLAAAIPMHWVVLLTPMAYKTIAIVAILTIYHNIQYHRLIWFHNKKYSAGEDAKQRYGAAAFINRNMIYYAAFALLFGLIYQGPRQYVLGYELQTKAPWVLMVGAFLWGVPFNHYYLDSKIWRVRRDPSVGKALKME